MLTTAVLVLAGCHSPAGGWFPRTGGSNTYFSTETRPTTVTIVDTRNGETIFTMAIPVGRQLTIQFDDKQGDEPTQTPDVMRYRLFEIGTQIGIHDLKRKLRRRVAIAFE